MLLWKFALSMSQAAFTLTGRVRCAKLLWLVETATTLLGILSKPYGALLAYRRVSQRERNRAGPLNRLSAQSSPRTALVAGR